MKKKLLIVVLSAVTVIACLFGVAGCTNPKTFEKSGMQITLTNKFMEKEYVSMTAYYESSNAIVTVVKEFFTDFTSLGVEVNTLEDYTDIVISGNGLTATKHTRENQDYIYFTYERSVSGKSFYYLATTHKSSDAYWLIQFACVVDNKEQFTETFLEYADSVTFVSENA